MLTALFNYLVIMKLFLLAVLMLSVPIGYTNAQPADTVSAVSVYSLIPDSELIPLSRNVFTISSAQINPSRSDVVGAAGWFLHGLKFTSVLDQFRATAPLDLRAYRPSSFSQYQIYIKQNELLIKDPVLIPWPDQ